MIELKNIQFKYPNNDKIILNNINLNIEKGKSYAFIGPTGEGKSTLALLISGLLTPTLGTITYNDKNLVDYTRRELANDIGYILQEPFLFGGTIIDNIIYGNSDFLDNSIFDPLAKNLDYLQDQEIRDILENKLLKILEQKNLNHLIEKFPNGLKTLVTNNSENISLGQKQLINFLRVILRWPKILILDEATANLDTITEKELQLILDNLSVNTTKIIIAHRLNTIKDVDYKYLVAGGRITKL